MAMVIDAKTGPPRRRPPTTPAAASAGRDHARTGPAPRCRWSRRRSSSRAAASNRAAGARRGAAPRGSGRWELGDVDAEGLVEPQRCARHEAQHEAENDGANGDDDELDRQRRLILGRRCAVIRFDGWLAGAAARLDCWARLTASDRTAGTPAHVGALRSRRECSYSFVRRASPGRGAARAGGAARLHVHRCRRHRSRRRRPDLPPVGGAVWPTATATSEPKVS